jgi:hypothetical protein
MRLVTGAGRAVLAAAAAAVAINLGATMALAASTTLSVKVTNGGTGIAVATSATLTDGTFAATCSTSGKTSALSMTSLIPTGTQEGTAPFRIGPVEALTVGHCKAGSLGAVTATFSKLYYSFKADSKTNGLGDTAVLVTGVSIAVAVSGCTFDIAGSMPAYYTNSTGDLTFTTTSPVQQLTTAALVINNAVGCTGIVNNADHVKFSATAPVSVTGSTGGWKIKATIPAS